jgi:UDP-N-acetyl-D-galactosamine dehydrogenase
MTTLPSQPVIAVIGLGYVGLPLAAALAEKYPVRGFDINKKRITELNSGVDVTLELENSELTKVLVDSASAGIGLFCTSDKIQIADCNVYIVTVPTPVDKYNRPDLTPMIKASETVASVLSKGNVVIYESTVYPGVTEDECVPVLERLSGLKFNVDFTAGYSPERINPGDKERTVKKIKKVTSGSTPEAADFVDNLYSSVITAGTHKAPSIKVAEAAKVIENAQRDINIAFVNELAKIFNRLHIDTHSVLAAAGTKWNFLPYKPGLVGGHCIGVDPYYLAQKAQETGYHPEIILAGRRLNDGMGEYVATEVIFQLIRKGNVVKDSKALVLGITFKENCPDIRNSRVIDVVNALSKQGVAVDVYDPYANAEEVHHEYGIHLVNGSTVESTQYNAVILAVAHADFISQQWRKRLSDQGILYDVKGVLDPSSVDGRL